MVGEGKMQDKFRLAVVGCGNIARAHVAACQSIPGVTFAVAYDTDVARAVDFAATWGFESSTDDIGELARHGVNVAAICTPHPTHAALIERLASDGIHCMVEKPLDVDLAKAAAALRRADEANIKVGVIFQRRYWPAAQRMRQLIDSGRFGRIVQGECLVHFSRTPVYFSKERSPWRGRWDTEGGGVTVNQASHALDTFQWLMGPIDSIYARWANLTHPGVEVDTAVAATFAFKDGALGTASLALNPRQTERGFSQITIYSDTGNWAALREEPEGAYGLNVEWEVQGEEADMQRRTETEKAEGHRMYRIVDKGRKPPELMPDCHRLQYIDFLAYLRGNGDYRLTGYEGLKTVQIIDAVYRSARLDRPVKLDDPAVLVRAAGAVTAGT
jgi:UDP-N-acetyl-2-amino-2-deoxyglucuronate dehydrogenase